MAQEARTVVGVDAGVGPDETVLTSVRVNSDGLREILRVVRPAAAEIAVRAALIALGVNVEDASMKDTPRRWVKAFLEMTEGEDLDPAPLLKVDFDASRYDQVVALSDISFVSLCEHHLLPFVGKAHVAYLPKDGKVVGLSKLARVVEVFARRLQLQERMTEQVAEALWQNLSPRGVAVVIEAEHQCMACRGVRKPGAVMRTSALRGQFMDNSDARKEVFQLLLRR